MSFITVLCNKSGWVPKTYYEVSISSNGRCEMSVVVQSQPIVTEMVWGHAGMVWGHTGVERRRVGTVRGHVPRGEILGLAHGLRG